MPFVEWSFYSSHVTKGRVEGIENVTRTEKKIVVYKDNLNIRFIFSSVVIVVVSCFRGVLSMNQVNFSNTRNS